MATNVIVLDCQKMFVEGMQAYFELHKSGLNIIDRICTSKELSETIQENSFDLLIMDLNIPDRDGIEIIKEIKNNYPERKVLVVSSYCESKFVRSAMVKGADGYISKKSSFSELLYAVEEVMIGKAFIGDGLRTSPAVRKTREPNESVSDYADSYTQKNKLTRREQEILELITQGKNNKAIGSELYISDQTVGVHRKNIMKKLGIRNTVSLIKYALENQLV